MLMMTPGYAAYRERKADEVLTWLEREFGVRPLQRPVIARLVLDRPKAHTA